MVWMQHYIVLLEHVSESHWAIEKSSLDKVNKTRVEVDLNVSDQVPHHLDRLKEHNESTSLIEETCKYLSVLISGPLPGIDVHVILDQCLDTFGTVITNAKLENGDVVRGSTSHLSTVMG
jgi:uncharacterized protein YciI